MERTIEIIKAYEGLCLEAQRCPAGVWTIGWGHTEGVSEGMTVSVAEANRLIREDVGAIWKQLEEMESAAGIELLPNRRRALCSFIFNVGIGAFSRSTLWRRVRTDPSDPRIRTEFMRWTRGGGRVLPGLVNRRTGEAALYFSGC